MTPANPADNLLDVCGLGVQKKKGDPATSRRGRKEGKGEGGRGEEEGKESGELSNLATHSIEHLCLGQLVGGRGLLRARRYSLHADNKQEYLDI